MATNQGLTQFIVWAPDYTDPDAPERRRVVRPSHLENARKLATEGVICVGGPVFTSDSADAAPADRKFFGTCFILVADSLEAARRLVENDVYYKSDVWDKEKIQVLPMLLVTPLAVH